MNREHKRTKQWLVLLCFRAVNIRYFSEQSVPHVVTSSVFVLNNLHVHRIEYYVVVILRMFNNFYGEFLLRDLVFFRTYIYGVEVLCYWNALYSNLI